MPEVNGRAWRHGRARLVPPLTSDEAAEQLGITGGALRQIESEVKPASLELGYAAARLYEYGEDNVHELFRDVEPAQPDKGKPAPKKVEPKVERVAPPTRDGTKKGSRPRIDDQAAAS
jgi:DNA-binding XRE family transcriptional regulator